MSLVSRPPATAGVVIGWLFVNGFFLLKNGMITTGEAGKYIHEAQSFLQTGHLESHNFIFYSVTIFLLSTCLKLHLGFGWVLVIQGGFALAATLSFHKTLLFLLRSPAIALIATGLLLLNLPYQALNTSLQTESLFQSISLLFVCRLLRQQSYSQQFLLTMLLYLAILTLIRPTGLLYWPLGAIYLGILALASQPPVIKIITVSLAMVGILIAINLAMSSGGEFDFSLPFREEHIICGSPTLLTPRAIPVSGSGNSVFSLLYYIFHDFGSFLRLAGLKTLSFWAIYRNYYSSRHNIFLAIYFYPIIILALLSLPRWKRNGLLLQYACLATPIAMTWLTVLLTCDDWSNRFFLSISPLLLLLAAGAWAPSATATSSNTSSHNRY